MPLFSRSGVLVVALLLTACGSTDAAAPATTSTPATTLQPATSTSTAPTATTAGLAQPVDVVLAQASEAVSSDRASEHVCELRGVLRATYSKWTDVWAEEATNAIGQDPIDWAYARYSYEQGIVMYDLWRETLPNEPCEWWHGTFADTIRAEFAAREETWELLHQVLYSEQ